VRGKRQHFTYSKVMAWVAFDRGIKMCAEFGLTGQVDLRRAVRGGHQAEMPGGRNDELGSFTQSYGRDQLDASVLLLR
jgi:GH15 family glucan-1,4-alpha-glucosidase